MFEESIEEKAGQFRDGLITAEELRVAVGPWLDKALAGERELAAGYGSQRRDDKDWIIAEFIKFLESKEARSCENLFQKLKSIVKRRADIRHNFVSLQEVEPFLSDPKGNEERRLEEKKNQVDWTGEVALDFKIWRETFNEVMRRHDDVSNFLKAAGTGHPLWQIYSAFTWKNYKEFLLVAHRLAGQLIHFPTLKSLQNATVELEIEQYRNSTIPLDDLTARLNEKFGLDLSEQTVGRWRRKLRKKGPLDLERENANRDVLLRKFSKIRLAKRETKI